MLKLTLMALGLLVNFLPQSSNLAELSWLAGDWYRKEGEDTLTATVDGGEGSKSISFAYRRMK